MINLYLYLYSSRNRRDLMKKIIAILLFSVLVLFNNPVFAGEEIQEAGEEIQQETMHEEGYVYHFPVIKPEFSGLLGYRPVTLRGSTKAGEFEYLHNSIPAGAEIRLYPFPHRIHFEADMLNKKDYFIDMRYAYKDLVLFRGIDRALFHNLDNITLIDLNPANTSPRVDIRDRVEGYGISVDLKSIFLRFKTPDFPLHVYVDGRFLNKTGDMQQRFQGGSGSWSSPMIRTSLKKNIDYEMKDITIGTNTHLGPIEVDISHGEQSFNANKSNRLSWAYTASSSRAAGTYPYSLISETKAETNTLKLHTSYTGKLVASATLSKTDKENRDSGVKAEYFAGSADVTYTPYTFLAFVARYKHKETALENPTTIPAGYLGYSAYNTAITGVKSSLSSQTDTFSGLARYRPFTGLGLNAEYTYERTGRKNADAWKMPPSVIRKNITLSANAKLMKKLTLKAKYSHQNVDTPAYNTMPNQSNSGSIAATWTPLNWASAMLSYNLAKEKNHNIIYVTSSDAYSTVGAKDRTVKRERLLGSLTFMSFKKFSITPSYAYSHSRIAQDVVLLSQLDKNVPYKDAAHTYAIGMNYAPQNNFNINADASKTKGKGDFYPGNTNALLPVSVASFSELKIKQTAYSVGSSYKTKGNWTMGAKYRYNSFRDMIDNPYDDAGNGIVRIILFTISKEF